MKKSIRKIISDNISLSASIGIAGGVITLILAVLTMSGSDLLIGVIIAAVLTVIGSLGVSVSAKKSLNEAVSDCVDKLNAGEELKVNAPEELETLSKAVKSGSGKWDEIEFISKLSEGDFSAQLPESLKNTETGKSLQQLADSLNSKFTSICRGAEQVNADGAQVSGAFASLSVGAEEQEGALQQLSQSVDSIKGTVDATAENAHKANKIASEATAEIEAGNAHMQALLTAMDNISKSTDEITKFVKVIEDIAFQTNILALNSSVEAARAGGAGKGFAVVAGEVKTLATKSQEAAQQTTAVIEECVRNVREGVAKTGETAKSLAAIAEETREVSRLVSVISGSCEEQRGVIGQIDSDVDKIGAAVHRTGSVAQACAASAQQLASRSDALKTEIDGLNLKSDAKTASRTARPAVQRAERPAAKPAPAEKPVLKAETKPAEKAAPAKPAPAPVTRQAPAPRSAAKSDSYANAEFVEVPDSKY